MHAALLLMAAAPAEAAPVGDQTRADEIVVTGRTDSQLAVFGDLSVRDTPISVRVVGSEAIAERGAVSLAQILVTDPSYVSINGVPELGSGLTSGNIRGFPVTRNFTNGLPQSIDVAFLPAEAIERVEVLRGVAGFNYGFLSPGGAVNAVTKSPRGLARSSLTLRRESVGSFAGHGETEGSVAGGAVGYRFNLAGSAGDTFLTDTETRRLLASAAFDYQIAPSTKLFLDGYLQDWDTSGNFLGRFAALGADGNPLPGQSLRRLPIAVPTAKDDILAWTIQGRATHDFSDQLSLVASAQFQKYDEVGVLFQFADRFWAPSGNNVVSGIRFPLIRDDFGASARLNYTFATGQVEHALTLTGQYNNTIARGGFASSEPYRYNIYTGRLDPAQPISPTPIDFDQRTDEYGVALAYTIEPTRWSRIIVGGRYSSISVDDRDAETRALLSTLGGDKLTPFVGIMVDATDQLSFYGNYAQGLERGGRAPPEASNAGEQLPPLVSDQVEFGFKLDLFGGLGRLDGAVFEIERPSEYFLGVGTPFVQDGLQRHRGAELVLSGKLAPRFRVTGGVQYLDAKLLDTGNPAVAGSRPTDIPEWQVALGAELDVAVVPGLTVTGNVFAQSDREIDLPNNRQFDGYAKFDLGAQYRTSISGNTVTVRARIENVANARYIYAAAFRPFFGAPRLFSLSAMVEF